MQHPVQALATVDSLLITACSSTLNCFDLSNSTQVSTSTPHKSLIRSLATFTDLASSSQYLISTGEDKQLIVSKLPSLELVSQRELIKRANALEVTKTGEIIVGDKFGDVYTFPLHPRAAPTPAPSTAGKEKKLEPEYLPILGHVSMLNTLALLGDKEQYIATGDRDEHVRISRFPLGHVIEGFLWGSKHFVSSLLCLPPSTTDDRSLLLSAGGDPTIQVFKLNLPTNVGELVGQYEISSLLLPHVKVAPVLPDPVPAGRKKDKKGKNKSTAGEGEAEAEGEGEVEVEEEEKKELKTGLAVIKMLQVGTAREQGGVIVLAAGCTALLYIPFSSLLSTSTTDRSHSLLEFPAPILDFTPLPIPVSSTSALEFLVSLDLTRPSDPSSSSIPSLVRVSLDQSTHQLSLIPSENTQDENLLSSLKTTETTKQPDIASLYPVLMMLHHPGDESDLLEGATTGGGGGIENVGDGKPKGGIRAQVPSKKRTSSERLDADREGDGKEEAGRKSGKRAVGRAETLRRWEEAKRKLEEGKGVESLSKGEKEAKDVMEMEEQQKEEAK
ncbi:Trm82p [Sporobolomyces salmoneus]|uniref:Trm82p n=1 Tax=Sporobolomyces salmoneus TaxID=183962 RepID=UPI00317A7845